MTVPGTGPSPRTAEGRLLTLLRRFRLRPREKQVIVAVLVSPRPLTVRQLAGLGAPEVLIDRVELVHEPRMLMEALLRG